MLAAWIAWREHIELNLKTKRARPIGEYSNIARDHEIAVPRP